VNLVKIETWQERDETGNFEAISWDLFPIVISTETQHLQDNGVPKIGVKIKSGMIIVGKIAKTSQFDPNKGPNSLEIHGWPFEKLKATYGKMWKDTSIYSTEESEGTVVTASVEKIGDRLRATVEIDIDS
jgi:DNA-directed RNA polymerase beta subunit